jgi:hypothetical protein
MPCAEFLQKLKPTGIKPNRPVPLACLGDPALAPTGGRSHVPLSKNASLDAVDSGWLGPGPGDQDVVKWAPEGRRLL